MLTKVLVGCEKSAAIASRFRDAGYEAWSCDLEPCELDGWRYHITEDIFEVLSDKLYTWDLIICHPPCTTLSVSGNHVYAEGKEKWFERHYDMAWTENLWELAKLRAPCVAFENPVGVLPRTSMGKATQYIQPYEFGDDASKKTGLWLHNLPPLVPTERVTGRMVNGIERWSNQCDSGQNKLGPSPTRATERSRTYPGIADAIVAQWGPVCTNIRQERRA